MASAEKAVSSMSARLWIGITATPDFGTRKTSVDFDNASRSATAAAGAVACPANILGQDGMSRITLLDGRENLNQTGLTMGQVYGASQDRE